MGVFFIYILKSSVCLVLFYLFFRLLLSKETFHRFNRMALLGVLFFSLLIPCIEVTTRHQVEVQQAVLSIEQLLLMAELEATPANVGAVQETPTISWVQIVLLVYLAGILFLVCRNIYSLICLFRLVHSGKHEKLEKGVTLVVHNQEIAPFSWMKYIVISRKDLEENGREILIHEMAHIHHRHLVDLLVADICIFFQWFNPGAWLLKQELQNIHEYEADETVINEGVNAKEYQLLLIKKAVGTRLYSMANSFNHSKLKNRITMMLRKKSSRWTGARVLLLLPLTALALGAFAETVYLFPEDKGKKENLKIRTSAPDGADPLVLVDGREQPASSINDITPERIQSITVLKDSTAIRMYGDKGRNGVVLVELKKEGDGTPQSDADDVTVVGYASSDDAPIHIGGKEGALPEHVLYLVDGERVPEIGSLDPGRIESVSVLKGKDNIPSEYAGQGYEGVIEIRTKKKSDGVRVLSPEEARAYFESKEGKEVQRSLDRMEEYFKSDEWKEAQRKMEASGEYFNSDEWKEAQRKMDAYFKSDEWKEARRKMEASSEYFKSDEWQEALRKMEASGEYFNSDEWKEAQLRLKELDKLSDRLGSEDGLGIVIRNASIGKGAFAGMKVYIDGREASSEEVDRLDPEKIRHMEVLTGKKAVRRYGEQASEGVVEIKTRK